MRPLIAVVAAWPFDNGRVVLVDHDLLGPAQVIQGPPADRPLGIQGRSKADERAYRTISRSERIVTEVIIQAEIHGALSRNGIDEPGVHAKTVEACVADGHLLRVITHVDFPGQIRREFAPGADVVVIVLAADASLAVQIVPVAEADAQIELRFDLEVVVDRDCRCLKIDVTRMVIHVSSQ